MSIASADFLTTDRIPISFSEKGLFHEVGEADRLLNLSNLSPNSSILDIGSGTGELVADLNRRGMRAYGLDILKKDQAQKASVSALSSELPFTTNSFDVVINHWGGITYPLMDSSFDLDPKLQKAKVVMFLDELQEALRVSSNEVRIHPWSIKPFYEDTGIIVHDGEDEGLQFLLIDIKTLLEKSLVTSTMGNETSTSPYLERSSEQPITISKASMANTEAFADLKEIVMNTEKSLWIGEHELRRKYPEFGQAIKDLAGTQGLVSRMEDTKAIVEKSELESNNDWIRKTLMSNYTYIAQRMGVDIHKLVLEDPKKALAIVKQINLEQLEKFTAERDLAKQRYVSEYKKISSELFVG